MEYSVSVKPGRLRELGCKIIAFFCSETVITIAARKEAGLELLYIRRQRQLVSTLELGRLIGHTRSLKDCWMEVLR